MCWLEHRKGQAAVVVGKEVGQGKMDGGPSAGKKKEGSQLVWFGNLAHGRHREEKYFFF
jgi:hypothetical protein